MTRTPTRTPTDGRRATRRRLGRLAGACAAVLAAALAVTGTALADELTEVNPGAFPNRAYALQLDTRRNLTADEVEVTENGGPVDSLTVVPAGSQAGASVTILAIDASNSMRGAPIAGALQAARAFASQKSTFAQIGLVAFNNQARLLLSPTANKQAILEALAKPPELAEGTRIYDGLALAGEALQAANARIGSIVLLSDGNDVGSVADPEATITSIADRRYRVFPIGLRSEQFEALPLQQAAVRTGGSYNEATTAAGLRPLFEEIGFRLGREYLILYRSLQKPEQPVDVAVKLSPASVPLTSSYTTPALPETTAPGGKSALDKFIQSPITLVGLVIVVIGLCAAAISQMLSIRRRSFRKRIAGFLPLTADEEELRRAEVAAIFRDSSAGIRKVRGLKGFVEDCELADIEMSPQALAYVAFAGGVLFGVVLAVGTGVPIAILAGIAVPLGVRQYVRFRVERKRRKFMDQLPDNLDVLGQALRAGHSLVGAISVVASNADEPSATEFARVVQDEQLGVTLEDALGAVVQRMQNRDLDQVAVVALLQRDAGGNAAEVIDQVSQNIRVRMELRRLVRVLTAQGRLARWILTLLPVMLFLILLVISTEYIEPLWQKTPGIIGLIVAAILVTLGSQIIKKIVNIKI